MPYLSPNIKEKKRHAAEFNIEINSMDKSNEVFWFKKNPFRIGYA